MTEQTTALPAWQTMDTAPKGEPRRYGRGPLILGVAVGDGWHTHQIVRWGWHANAKTGAWGTDARNWEPDFWMPLRAAPKETAHD